MIKSSLSRLEVRKMNFSSQRRLEEMKQEYISTHKKQEEILEEIHFQNREFEKGLDDLADRFRYVASHYNFEQIPPMRQGYSILSKAHEEGSFLVKKQARELEEEIEQTTREYNMEKTRYEEEYSRTKKEGERS